MEHKLTPCGIVNTLLFYSVFTRLASVFAEVKAVCHTLTNKKGIKREKARILTTESVSSGNG
jgi:hypothetical protein